jgi:hypothetical protein
MALLDPAGHGTYRRATIPLHAGVGATYDPKPTRSDPLLDHLIGLDQENLGHFKAQRLRSLEIDG